MTDDTVRLIAVAVAVFGCSAILTGFLVKLLKKSNILDIPTIGENTIKLLKECNYEGIFIEKDSCLIIDKEKTVDLANQYKVFISTCNKYVN